MMKRLTLVTTAAVFFIVACTAPAPPTPASDTTPPEITVTVSRARGRNVFKSIDGPLKAPENCIIIDDRPVQLILIAGDAGGLASVSLSTSGTIVPGSIDVTPRAPESTLSTPAGGVLITLPPPSPTTVRTGVVAILEVDGITPTAVTAWARDHAGQTANLEQFDLRREFEKVICRNSNLK